MWPRNIRIQNLEFEVIIKNNIHKSKLRRTEHTVPSTDRRKPSLYCFSLLVYFYICCSLLWAVSYRIVSYHNVSDIDYCIVANLSWFCIQGRIRGPFRTWVRARHRPGPKKNSGGPDLEHFGFHIFMWSKPIYFKRSQVFWAHQKSPLLWLLTYIEFGFIWRAFTCIHFNCKGKLVHAHYLLSLRR